MPRLMGVDPGEARIGLALSDPSGSIARPLTVIQHSSRGADARAIAQLAQRHGVERIVVGLALDQQGQIGPQARKALRLAEALRANCAIPVVTWDESGSTELAAERGSAGTPLDARAAAVILQEYLDAQVA